MPELESALRALGAQIEFPATPDLASGLRGRLGRPRGWRRPLIIALAALVVVVGAILAVPPARTAVFDRLGLRGVAIPRVDELPPAPHARTLDLGRLVSLDEARARAPWLVVPDNTPDAAYLKRGSVTLLWGTPRKARLLLSEFPGQAYIEKLVD